MHDTYLSLQRKLSEPGPVNGGLTEMLRVVGHLAIRILSKQNPFCGSNSIKFALTT